MLLAFLAVCMVDLSRLRTVIVERLAKVLCRVSHLQYVLVDVARAYWAMIGGRFVVTKSLL